MQAIHTFKRLITSWQDRVFTAHGAAPFQRRALNFKSVGDNDASHFRR